jgi:ABC-type multidrug transport system fused ATPase/permease subunit
MAGEAAAGAVAVGATTARVILRRFWPWVRPHRVAVAVVLAASLMLPLLEAAGIWVFKLAVDRLLVPKDLSFFPVVVLAYGLLAAAGAVLGLASDFLSAWVSERFLLALRTDLFRHTQKLPVDYLTQRRLGDLLSSLTSDVSAIEEFLFSGFFRALVHAVRVPVFASVLFVMNWKLAAISIVVAPAFWGSAHYFARRLRTISRERRQRSGAAASVAEETLSNAPIVRACNGEELQAVRYEAEGDGVRRARLAAARLRAISSPVTELLEATGVLLVLWLGTTELSSGALTLGTLVAFLTLLGRVYSPLQGLSGLTTAASSASAAAERILELLDRSPEPVVAPDARRLGPVRGEVAFEHVRFRYPGADRDTLQDVSFRVSPGEVLAIVGPSGSGKSTVLRLLLRFHDPGEGRVLLDGQDLRGLEPSSVREALGVLLQEPHLFHATIRENIAFGRGAVEHGRVEAAARLADAHDFIQVLPGGYDTLLGQKGSRLSGGQRQRLALARAFLREAPVLVLDEPTTGLDPATAGRVVTSLRRLAVGRAVIVLAHDARAVPFANRVLAMVEGRLVESLPARDEARPAVAAAGEPGLRSVP